MNKTAFLQLIQENMGILYKISVSYCRNASDREDLMQEMIYQLWKSAGKFDETYKFSTWMYRIALNVAISFYRKVRARGVRVSLVADAQLMELADYKDGHEELEERIELLQQFIGSLGALAKAVM